MELNKISVFIDGISEEGALKAWFSKNFSSQCPNFVRTCGNGKDYSIETFIEKEFQKVLLCLSKNSRHIIFIPDFEKREKNGMTLNTFITQLKAGMVEICASNSRFKPEQLNKILHFCSPNIMFENWIVADIDGIKQSIIKIKGEQQNYDGKNGSSVLRNMMGEVKYLKTTHAKILYKQVRGFVASQNSPSFKLFFDTIQGIASMSDE